MDSFRQFRIPLPDDPAYGVADFMVSDCNQGAFMAVHRWPDWPQPVLLLFGPAASGKSHLAHIWAARSNGRILPAKDLNEPLVQELIARGEASESWVVEDVQQLGDEASLFHLLNAVREQGGYLMVTADRAANQLPLGLPDLRSRLLAVPAQGLEAPDETVLTAVIVKQFSDRQMRVPEEVIAYLLARMERSFKAARDWVHRIDEASLGQKGKVSIPLVRQLLEADRKAGSPTLFS